MGTQNYSQVMQAYTYIYIVTYYANNVLSVAQRSIDLHLYCSIIKVYITYSLLNILLCLYMYTQSVKID